MNALAEVRAARRKKPDAVVEMAGNIRVVCDRGIMFVVSVVGGVQTLDDKCFRNQLQHCHPIIKERPWLV